MNKKILFPLFIGFFMGFAFLSLPPALDKLMSLYGVSYTGISFLLSAMLWSHAIMQIPAGLFTDRLGVKRTIFIGLILLGAGSLMGAVTPSYTLALIGRVITGIGMGLTFVTNMKLIALYAPKNRIGSFQAFSTGFFSIGSILAFLLIPHITKIHWQWVYLLPGLGCVPLLLYLPRLNLESSLDVMNPLPVLGRIIRMPSAWVLGLIHAMGWGTVLTFGNWLPSVLAEVWGSATANSFAWS
ncbi:nitrate/nitrite transporter, partial [Thermodesulfobacteriota bacterium]